ncbi:MAG: hypothetical protein ABSE93_14485 [Terriglobia bacterium]|jgi:hypothetical protein
MYLFKQIDAPNIYAPVRNVQIGLAPLIWRLVRNKAVKKSPPDGQGFPWQLDGAEILRSCLSGSEPEQVQSYKLVADILDAVKNASRKYAQLFEVCEIFGFSGWNWTPMLWKLRLLYECDDCTDARDQGRWKFDPVDSFVYEFLRLQADHNWERTRQGRRDFGMVGKFNGVLLWPEALRYFIGKMDLEKGTIVIPEVGTSVTHPLPVNCPPATNVGVANLSNVKTEHGRGCSDPETDVKTRQA